MKTSTILILVGVGLVGVYVVTRKSAPLTGGKNTGASSSSPWGALGQVFGGIISAGNLFGANTTGPMSAGSNPNAMQPGIGYDGDSSIAIVRGLDSSNIAAYDAQGTPDAPVYGIAGIDY